MERRLDPSLDIADDRGHQRILHVPDLALERSFGTGRQRIPDRVDFGIQALHALFPNMFVKGVHDGVVSVHEIHLGSTKQIGFRCLVRLRIQPTRSFDGGRRDLLCAFLEHAHLIGTHRVAHALEGVPIRGWKRIDDPVHADQADVVSPQMRSVPAEVMDRRTATQHATQQPDQPLQFAPRSLRLDRGPRDVGERRRDRIEPAILELRVIVQHVGQGDGLSDLEPRILGRRIWFALTG